MSAVRTVQTPSVTVLETVPGQELVDHRTAGRAHRRRRPAAAARGGRPRSSGDLLVHLAGAEVHDATGLGVIVGAHHRAAGPAGRLVLVDVSPRLDRLLRASRLHRVLARGRGARAGARLGVSPLTA